MGPSAPGLKRFQSAVNAACLALALVWNVAAARRFARYDSDKPTGFSDYAGPGEILAHGIISQAGSVSYKMPLATIVSAPIRHYYDTRYGVLLAVNGVLMVLMVFALGLLLHPYGGFLAGLAVVVASYLNFDLNPDSGYTFPILLSAGFLVWRARAPSAGRSAWLAAAVGVSLMWRSPLAFFTPALALYEWSVEHRFSFKAYRKQFLILCIAPYLFLLPWIAMNWTIYRQLVIFERGAAGANIVTGALGLVGNVEGDLRTLVDKPIHRTNTGEVISWAVHQVIRHPRRYARAYVLRIAYVLSSNPLVALFAVAGFWVFRRRREYRELFFMAAYFLGIHCFMTVEERYFWPLWPLLALLACSLPAGVLASERPLTVSLESRLASASLKTALMFALALSLYANWKVLSFANLVRRGRRDFEEEISDALRSNPDDTWLLDERGKERLDRSDFAGAAEDFSRAAALEPENHSAQLDLARAEALLGKPGRLLAWNSEDPDALSQIDADIFKACAYLRLGRKGEARRHLEAAWNKYRSRCVVVRGPQGPLEKQAYDRLRLSDAGFVQYVDLARGPRPVAEELALNELLAEVDPDFSEVWIEGAKSATELGKRNQALEFLAQAEKRGLDTDEKRRGLLRLYRELKEYGRASALLETLSRSHPDDAGLAIEGAELAAELGKRGQALAFLAQAEKRGLDTDEKQWELLRLYQRLKEYGRASALLETLSRNHPYDAGPLIERAELAAQQGKRGEALEFLARIEKEELDTDAKLQLLQLYRELKEYGRAFALLEALSRRRPNDAGLSIERAELTAELGKRGQGPEKGNWTARP